MSDQLNFFSDSQRAQLRSKMPQEPIIRSADVCGPYRFSAKRAWGAGAAILWCGFNPSLADGTRDDPTMNRIIGFSYRWGFGSAIIVNMHPFVTPSPIALRRWLKQAEKEYAVDPGLATLLGSSPPAAALVHNRTVINGFLHDGLICVAAWGQLADPIEAESFIEDVGFNFSIDWYCLGTNENGSPRHPLSRGKNRVPDHARLSLWRKASSNT